MKLVVENIERVRKAEIQLDGITVLAGKNGSGKTTLLKLLEAFVLLNGNQEEIVQDERKRSIADAVPGWVVALLKANGKALAKEGFSISNEQFVSWIVHHKTPLTNEDCLSAMDLDKFFSTGSPVISKEMNEQLQVINTALLREDKPYLAFASTKLVRKLFNGGFSSILSKGDAVAKFSWDNEHESVMTGLQQSFSFKSMENHPCTSLVFSVPRSFITMDENGIAHYDNYLLKERNYQEESLENAQELENNTNIIKDLIASIIHGKFVVSSGIKKDVLFKDDEIGAELALCNTASGVLPFAVIDRAISNGTLRKNGVVIIDEPEMNIHPEWQVKFASLLVSLYKQMGIRTMLATHSPFFIRAMERALVNEEVRDMSSFYLMTREEDAYYSAKDVSKNTALMYDELFAAIQGL